MCNYSSFLFIGLAIDPSNQILLEGLAEAEKQDQINRGTFSTQSHRTTGSSAAPPPSGSPGEASTMSLKQFVWGDRIAKARTLQFVLRFYMVINAVG